ncbi:MAG TPA: AMP-binding protein, partial [Gemmatimonadales bacterium]|nr:AMP-binding protein [Gemmatimonadales bacterium]
MASATHLLIGGESLLVHCGEALRRAGHGIVGVVTASPDVTSWATGAGLRVLPTIAALEAATELEFDVLLSVGNLEMVPAAQLARARLAAINFHDGPLPEHGGLNVPAWAILQRATEHGITWHLMTGAADAGAIVAERRFAIADAETTLTLNTRCFEAGIESFGDVLAAIESRTLPTAHTGQAPRRLSRRDDRPPAAGAIDWSRPAAELCALVRGLDHGQYANPLVTAKALVGSHVLVVPALRPLGRQSGPAAGTVLAIDDEGLTVATATQDVLVPRFRTLTGAVLGAREAAMRANLRVGDVLRLPDALAARLTTLTKQAAAHERWWIGQLRRCEPGTLPFPERTNAASGVESLPLDLSALPVVPGHAPADVAIALVVGTLARLRGRGEFCVTYQDPALRQAVDGLESWFAPAVPVVVRAPFDATLEPLVASVAEDLAEVRRRHTFATDLPVRQPSLRDQPSASGRSLPIAVVLATEPDSVTAREGAEVTFVLAANGGRGRLLYDAARLTPEIAAALAERVARLARGFRQERARALCGQPLLADAERRRLLTEWNATDTPLDTSRTIDALVHERATLDPDRVAVTCRGRTVTYAELDRRVSRLARVLRARGVKPDDRVAVMLDRDVELVVALLGVLRAGGAYVPLDPEYPAQRLALMLADSGARLALTSEARRGSVPPFEGEALALEALEPECAAADDRPPAPAAGAANLAYVIYT